MLHLIVLGKSFADHIYSFIPNVHGHWWIPIFCGGHEGTSNLFFFNCYSQENLIPYFAFKKNIYIGISDELFEINTVIYDKNRLILTKN